jgi:hypothetical protein
MQAVMSFHAAGTNVGDTCTIPLPQWVLAAGDENPDIFYTDKARTRNRECLSLGCFQHPVLEGRSPREVCPLPFEHDLMFACVQRLLHRLACPTRIGRCETLHWCKSPRLHGSSASLSHLPGLPAAALAATRDMFSVHGAKARKL